MMIELSSLAAFSIKGQDAKKFLQGQLTCDINELKPNHILRAAHCNKEGRVMALYHLVEREDEIILITQKDLLLEAMQYLKHYGMFTKLTWQDLTNKEYIYVDEENRLLLSPEKIMSASQDESSYYYQQILQKQAHLTKASVGKFLPQELELSGAALSFTKGCYLGQEIIARLHYLGKLKRRLQVIESEQELIALDELLVDNKPIGEVIVSVNHQNHYYGLALINVNCDARLFASSCGNCVAI